MSHFKLCKQAASRSALLALCLMGLAGCKPEMVEVSRLLPAPVFTSHLRTLAVADFDGQSGDKIAEEIVNFYNDNGHSRLIPRSTTVLEQKIQGQVQLDSDKGAELAHKLGADALIFGHVVEDRQVDQEQVQLSRGHWEKNDHGRDVWSPATSSWVRTAQLFLRVTVEAVDRDGVSLGASSFIARSSRQQETSQWGWFGELDWSVFRQQAYASLPRLVARQLMPHYERARIVLYATRKLPESKEAIDAIRGGEFERAIVLYREGVRRLEHKGSKTLRSQAYYNLGMVLAQVGHAPEGLENLEKAYSLRPSHELQHIIDDVQRYGGDAARAREQLSALGGRQPPLPGDDDELVENLDEDKALSPWEGQDGDET